MTRQPVLGRSRGPRNFRLVALFLAALAPLAYRAMQDRPSAPPAPRAETRSESEAQTLREQEARPTARRVDSSRGAAEEEIAVDLEHVFFGEINRRGKPVGFHSRPGGIDPEGAHVIRVLDGPNDQGVYVAKVELRDRRTGRWLEKTSSIFPDELSREEVLAAIRNAHREGQGSEPFRGPSGLGFTIEGYFQDGKIATAYPIFRRRGDR